MAESLVLEGPMVQGGLVKGRVPPGTEVVFAGEPVRVSSEGDFLIGFHRDESSRLNLELTYPGGKVETRQLAVDKRDYNVQRIDGLPPSKVTPSEKDLERIYAESRLIKQARKRDDDRTDYQTGFIWPTVGRISGIYGSQRILNGKPRRPHYGIDIAAPNGTPVVAPADGIVTLAHPDTYFNGGLIAVDHGHGLSSWFSHLSRLLVKEGARVKRGDKIAEVGSTGRSTGPHLDWRINLFERRLDPSLLVGPMPSE
ncbi:MAG: M23 family metallopeptidase [Gammaproteobacteria bacterium]|nr:M23 family metallopeptidase [Gammaproteobacteria bacterium]